MKKNILLFLLLIAVTNSFFAQYNIEIPTIKSSDIIVKHLGYTLSYNELHEQASWVAYELTLEETKKGAERTDKFKEDLAVKTGSATSVDYKGSGYDRGHLAPAADMSWSAQVMQESFFYSNMSPQVPGFNRGIWKSLEEKIRDWAVIHKAIYVVTGPVLENDLPTIGPEKVSVPRYYYKVILDYTSPTMKGIGFIMPNASSTLQLSSYAVSIDSVEQVTGINFFPTLPDNQENKVEKMHSFESWSVESEGLVIENEMNDSNNEDNVTQKNDTVEKNGIDSLNENLNNTVENYKCTYISKSGNHCKSNSMGNTGKCFLHRLQQHLMLWALLIYLC